MKQSEYNQFLAEDSQVAPSIVTAERVGGENRTLTHGYDVDRNSFHVYVHDGILFVRTYRHDDQIIDEASGLALPAATLRPNKRVYPQYTDEHFARTMRDLDFPLPFTTWSEPRREGPYYGVTHLDSYPEIATP